MQNSQVSLGLAVGLKKVGLNCLSDRRGISALEFVLIAPMMLTIVLGVFDVGNAIQQSIQLRQAVRAGAQYALSFPDASDIPSKITAAITGMTANTPTVSAVACSCVDITTGVPTPNASCAPCLAGSILTRSITLGVSASYSALLLPISTLSASYVVRYQ